MVGSMRRDRRAPPLGIDLGTTNCCMAYLLPDGKQHVIKTSSGDRTLPSVVAFTKSRHIVGAQAKTDIECNDRNTIYDAKRLLGRQFDDPQVQEDMSCWPFDIICDPESGLPKYRVQERGKEALYAPEQISGLVLEELRKVAEQHFGAGVAVEDVVITVPAYFNDDQRQATKAAAAIAGLNVLMFINEPTAAALSFGLHNVPTRGPRHVLVFDLGGGTLDVVLLRHSEDVLEVKNLGGDTHLGGQDFDWNIMALALQAWDQQHPDIELENGTRGWRRLRLACEAARRELSVHDTVAIDLCEVTGMNQDLFLEITRPLFEFQVEPLLQRCMAIVTGVLTEAGFTTAHVDDLVVVGGASRMPWLRNALRAQFPSSTAVHMTDEEINADEAVALGAAVMAARVPRPHEDDDQQGLPPDELGPRVIDATARTLGIQHGGRRHLMHAVIPKGSPLPANGRQAFTTSVDYQAVIVFEVFEGEDPITDNNLKLGEFSLPGVAPAPAGSASITVTMTVDQDSVLQVSAIDNRSGTARELRVAPRTRMPEQELEDKKQEAARRREEAAEQKARQRARQVAHRNVLGDRQGSGGSGSDGSTFGGGGGVAGGPNMVDGEQRPGHKKKKSSKDVGARRRS